jgi:pheromone shutdown protein TraB
MGTDYTLYSISHLLDIIFAVSIKDGINLIIAGRYATVSSKYIAAKDLNMMSTIVELLDILIAYLVILLIPTMYLYTSMMYSVLKGKKTRNPVTTSKGFWIYLQFLMVILKGLIVAFLTILTVLLKPGIEKTYFDLSYLPVIRDITQFYHLNGVFSNILITYFGWNGYWIVQLCTIFYRLGVAHGKHLE